MLNLNNLGAMPVDPMLVGANVSLHFPPQLTTLKNLCFYQQVSGSVMCSVVRLCRSSDPVDSVECSSVFLRL